MSPMRLVAAPDKFRGTASAAEIAGAMADAARRAGWEACALPLADGGEGTLEVLGGPNRTSLVTGPLGDPVRAQWRFDRRTAVIEMARASGLELVGGADGNDPVSATTAGTGELMAEAVEAGARRLVVTLGGSATTDGGYGALEALEPVQRFRGVRIEVACDVTTRFLDAAAVFAPQKGATPAQVKLLRGRLQRLAQVYRERFGVDVTELDGAGAAGGLAGALAAVGAELRSGFDLVADELDLAEALVGADLVVTGEGYVDRQSLDGKVVGGVEALARRLGVPVLVVCGDADEDVELEAPVVSLVARFGEERAFADTTACVAEAVAEHLQSLDGGAGAEERSARATPQP
jgi:glycerate kinase